MKRKKKHLKSYVEFKERQIFENQLSQAQRSIAGSMMGGDMGQNPHLRFFVGSMNKLLALAEKKLGVNNNAQSGEETDQWSDQAIQLLQHALATAKTGSRNTAVQANQIKQAQKQAQKAQRQGFNQQAAGNPQAMGNMMNTNNAGVAQGSAGVAQQGPTPLNQI